MSAHVLVQIIRGDRDTVIPVSHTHLAHAAMPGSRLDVFLGSGHFPFHDDPARLLQVLDHFIQHATGRGIRRGTLAVDTDLGYHRNPHHERLENAQRGPGRRHLRCGHRNLNNPGSGPIDCDAGQKQLRTTEP